MAPNGTGIDNPSEWRNVSRWQVNGCARSVRTASRRRRGSTAGGGPLSGSWVLIRVV